MDFKNINQEEILGFAAGPIYNYDYQNIDHLLWPDDVFETPHAEIVTCIQLRRRPEEAQNLVRSQSFRYDQLGPNSIHVVIRMADCP